MMRCLRRALGVAVLGLAFAVALLSPRAAVAAVATACPATVPVPTNDIDQDMERVIPLGYELYPALNIFHVFWGENWDSMPGNFKQKDIEDAMKAIIGTPYFDNLCQYGIPGFTFEGKATSDSAAAAFCGKNPGSEVSTVGIFEWMLCEEYTPFTGVPLAFGAPNPICGLDPLLPADPSCLLFPLNPACLSVSLCLLTPNPTGNRIYVVFLPKHTIIHDAVPPLFDSSSCRPDSYFAYHFQVPSRALFAPLLPPFVPGTQGRPINMAIIPTECFDTLEALMVGVTHEIVEAALSPLPILGGWVDESSAIDDVTHQFNINLVGSLFKDGEAADICDGASAPRFKTAGGLTVGVAPYWSNADNACSSLDVVAPVTTASAAPPPNGAGWNNATVTMTLTATDGGTPASGVREIVHSATGAQPIGVTTTAGSTTGVVVSAEGQTFVSFFARDNAGNVEAPKARTIRIDRFAPAIVGSAVPPANGAGWNNTPVEVSFTCTDAVSGIASCSAPTTLSSDGVAQSVVGTAIDRAQNVAATTVTGINIDRTLPVTTASAAPPPNGDGWNNAAVTMTLTATDGGTAGSGVREIVHSATGAQPIGVTTTAGSTTGFVVSAEGQTFVSFFARDNAGNAEATKARTIGIDRFAPTIVGSASPPANGAGWNNTPVVVSFTCTDAVSGIASCSAPTTLSSDGVAQSVVGTAIDRAQNVANTTVTGINIDRTPPSVTYTGNAGTYEVNQTVNITCAAADNLSGVAATTCANVTGPAFSFGLGPHTFSATASDAADNSGSGSVTFRVEVSFASLCSLTQRFSDKPGVAMSLCAKLDAAAAAANQMARAGLLGAYLNEVQAQTGKALTAAEAATLITFAKAL